MRFPHGETVYRHPVSSVTSDRYGNEVRNYDNPREQVAGVAFQPEQSSEADAQVIIPAQLMFSFAQPAEPFDRWEVRGLMYEQLGEAGRWRSPFTGWEAGSVVRLERVTG